MKIWIDLSNSPHINFFKPFILKWEQEGHEVILTARNLANTIDLIKQNNWKYKEVGGHAGKNKLKKLLYFPNRVIRLYRYLKKIKPEIGISQSSFYSPIVGKLLGIPTIYLNDNEHAKGNFIAFKFATLNMVPESLFRIVNDLGWNKKNNFVFYPGIKEGIYLSQSGFGSTSIPQEKKIIYVRLEPWTAEYYKGKNQFLDELIIQLSKEVKLTILPRGNEQAKHYLNDMFKSAKVAEKPIKLEEIYESCVLFIGAGGSMTRELAFLGIPTLSVYQDNLLEVDKYLINNGFMNYNTNPTLSEILKMIYDSSFINRDTLIKKGDDAFRLINNKVNELAKN